MKLVIRQEVRRQGYCPPGGAHPCLGWNSQVAPQVYQVLLTLVGGALTLAVWKWGVCTPERKPTLEGRQKAFSAPSSPHLSTSLDCILASGSGLWKYLVLGSCSLIYYVSIAQLLTGYGCHPTKPQHEKGLATVSPGGECSKANWSKYMSFLLTSQLPLKRGQCYKGARESELCTPTPDMRSQMFSALPSPHPS